MMAVMEVPDYFKRNCKSHIHVEEYEINWNMKKIICNTCNETDCSNCKYKNLMSKVIY